MPGPILNTNPVVHYIALSGEVGVTNDIYPYGDVRRYGAIADSGTTDNRPRIQNAIDSAAQSGAGFGRVYVPAGDGFFYGIVGALTPRNEVEMTGDGPLSYIKNTNPGPYSDAMEQQSCVFRLGAVEGGPTYRLDEDPYDVIGNLFAGSNKVTVHASPAVQNPYGAGAKWEVGDIVYLRSEEADPHFNDGVAAGLQKDLPLDFEINEIVAFTETTVGSTTYRELTLKYALRNDYPTGRAILHGKRADLCNTGGLLPNCPAAGSGHVSAINLKIETIKRFRLRNMKLDAPRVAGTAVFGHGGCFECEFTDLWVDDSGEFMQLNAMARCRFENIRCRVFVGFGELAYYSHDNTFRSLHVTHYVDPSFAPRNGINLTEHAGDNVLEDVHLDFNGPGYALVVSGKNNRIANSTFITAGSPSLAGVLIAAHGLTFKPRHCTLENVTVQLRSALPNTGTAQEATYEPHNLDRFGVLIDSGGPYGGFNTVRGLTVVGRPLVAAVGFARFDLVKGKPSAVPCENNLVDGVSQVYTLTETGRRIPATGTVVEYNNSAPVLPDGSVTPVESIIDGSYRWGSNVVVNGRTPTSQRADRRFGITTPVTLEYVVPAKSAGSHTSWKLQAIGHVLPAMASSAKSIVLRISGTAIYTISFAAGESGSWSLEADIGGRVPVSGSFESSTLLMGHQTVRWVAEKNGSVLRGLSELALDLNTTPLVLRVEPSATIPDIIDVDMWSVVPAGDEVSLINWELLKSEFGFYPDLKTISP